MVLPGRSVLRSSEQGPRATTRMRTGKVEASSARAAKEASLAKREGRSSEARDSRERSQHPRTLLRDWNSLTETWTNIGSREEIQE